jgi:hypothetical protein
MLHLSALLFLTNAAHAAFRELWLYVLAFISLATTSWVHHGNRDTVDPRLGPVHFWLDQVAVWAVILTGAYYLLTYLTPTQQLVPAIAFATVGLLYVYGAYANCFCFDRDQAVATRTHVCMHAISSVGHHAILAGL